MEHLNFVQKYNLCQIKIFQLINAELELIPGEMEKIKSHKPERPEGYFKIKRHEPEQESTLNIGKAIFLWPLLQKSVQASNYQNPINFL